LASQALFDLVGSHPWPLQEFWPLQALLADLHALVPLQELIPIQWTAFIAVLAEVGVTDMPFIARAIAATAREAPDTILVFILISLGIRSQDERLASSVTNPQDVVRSSGEQSYRKSIFSVPL
jgi:hypothetical protein